MNIHAWSLTSNAVHHYRIQEPLRGMSLLGHNTRLSAEVTGEDCEWADVLLTSVHGQEQASEGWQRIARMPNRPMLVFDIDDDVWNFDERLAQYDFWKDPEVLLRTQNDIAVADLVTTPSPVLAGHLAELNPNVVVLPNTVPEYLLWLAPPKPDVFTVGYQGGDTHRYDLEMVSPDLFRFLATHPAARMHVWGVPGYEGPFRSRVGTTGWNRSVKSYYLSLRMSVGLAPLRNTAFNHAKSGIKALEYAALGIPSVVSMGPTYDGWVFDGSTGFVVGEGDWLPVLSWLAANPLACATIGSEARRFAEGWTTERCAGRWVGAYGKVLGHGLVTSAVVGV